MQILDLFGKESVDGLFNRKAGVSLGPKFANNGSVLLGSFKQQFHYIVYTSWCFIYLKVHMADFLVRQVHTHDPVSGLRMLGLRSSITT